MLKNSLLISLLVLPFIISAQSGFKIAYIHPKSKLPGSIHFTDPAKAPQAENLSAWFKENLKANAEFQLRFVSSSLSQDGMQHYRYQQYYKNVKVLGAEIILHLKDNKAVSMNGKYLPDLKLDVTAKISSEQALSNCLNLFENAVFSYEVSSQEEMLKKVRNNPQASFRPVPELIIMPDDSFRSANSRLVYQTDLFVYQPYAHELIYQDALSGQILRRTDMICSIQAPGVAHTRYHGIQNIMCDSVDTDSFLLIDMTRGKGIFTKDVRIISESDSSRIFYDDDNIWNNVNQYQDEVATDVHWGSEMTYDYYVKRFDRHSYSHDSAMILSEVHFGELFNNAFWDGVAAHYGDGDGVRMMPLTSIDIVGHELTHGYTQHSCGLVYQDESGALNESLSDIFGKAIEYVNDSAGFSWNIAQHIVVEKDKPFRDMSDPLRRRAPKYYYGQSYYQGSDDNGGVHTNSGVQNYWFYLITVGGKGEREDNKNTPFTVDSLGWERAIRVVYTNQNFYLTSFSDYYDASYLSLDACTQLYGHQSFEYKQVYNAWYGVGVFDKSSIQDIRSEDMEWHIYPNPGHSQINFSHPLGLQSQEINVTDFSGKSVMNTSLSSGESLDVSGLSAGIYFIRIGNAVYKWVRY